MTLAQFVINLIIGIIAYAIARVTLPAEWGQRLVIALAVLVGIVVFLINIAARLGVTV